MHRGRSFAAALLLAFTVSAQQPRVDESIEVSIVNVDVHVTDKSGKPVTGLTAADFEIREEGKLQPITNFAEYATAATGGVVSIESASEAPAATVRPRRTIVFFIESARLNPFQAAEVYASLRKLVRDTVAPGDRLTIVTWKRAMAVKQPFTDDVVLLESVLSEMEKNHPRYDTSEGRQVRDEQAASDAADADLAAAASMTVGRMPPVHALEAARREYVQIRQKAAALEALMQSISALDGPKIVVMAMRRFGAYAGAEFFGGEVPVEHLAEFDTEKYRDSMIRTANAHGITLYPVYPTGLEWKPAFNENPSPATDLQGGRLYNKILFNETTALQDLAAATGGLMAWGAGNIAKMLPRVAEDLESYYSLGYRARATGKDVTRGIVVKTKNRDYEVRARRHFVEKSDESLMTDRVIGNLYQPLPGATLDFEVGHGVPVKDRRNHWTMPLQLRIPIAALTLEEQGRQYAGAFSVYIVTGGAVGVTSEVHRRSQPFRIPYADMEKAKSSYYTYNFTLGVDGEVDRVSVGLVDDVAKEFGLKRIAMPPKPAKE